MISKAISGPGQYGALGMLTLATLGITVIQARIDQSPYERFFGGLNPIGVMAVVSALGFGSLWYLMSRNWFVVFDPTEWGAGIVFAVKVVPLFAAAAVVADVLLRFPEDTNVGLPDAFLFYPSMAFFVEVCFHAVPFAVLVAVLGRLQLDSDVLFWVVVIVVAAIEAVFQSVTSASPALAVFSGIQLLLFGVVQLYAFRRFGFVPMLAFRLVYYALWHVAWGSARLHILF